MTSRSVPLRKLSPERWRTLEPLVDAAIELRGSRRSRFMDEACGEDIQLRAELEWMVAECLRSDPLLDRPATDRFAFLLEAQRPAVLPPAILAERFRLDRELGRGGMATVYLAYDLKHGREVALKTMRPEIAAFLGGERFLSEIEVTAALRHPHILPLFDSGEVDGCIYFVTPYVEGGSLRDWLVREGPLKTGDALRIAMQVAEGLEAAHAHGFVHRDVKPENILLAAGGRHAYVADFGIAMAISRAGETEAITAGLRLGTPAYMSPEQLHGADDLDGRTDIYSLGLVLHEMIHGKLPRRTAHADRLSARERGAAIALEARRQLRHRRLSRIVRRATDESPARRHETASELARDLRVLLESEGTSRARRWWAGAGAASGVAALLLGATSPAIQARVRGWIGSDVDSELTVVLPFRSDTRDRALLTGDNVARLLYDALGRWKDVRLGDELRAVEAGRRASTRSAPLQQARSIARSLGAGRFVWGEVTAQRGGTRISAQLYDERQLSQPTGYVAYVTSDDGDAGGKIEQVADSLIARYIGTPAASAGARGTSSFAALKKYADGYAALRVWNTDLAEAEFRAAAELDRHFPQAWLGVAQSIAWRGASRPPDWLDPASRALADSNVLSDHDRMLAGALVALAQWRMPEACDSYRRLLARDDRDFAAHFGLGECLSTDRVVIADRRSSTGWSFRGSLHSAIGEYRRALELVPSYLEGSRGQSFARLTERILFTDPGDYRRGFALTPDTLWFGAWPEIEGDTLAFHPRPRAVFVATPEPSSNQAAVARNRELLRALTARWVASFPGSAIAHEQHAAALEALGVLDTLDATRLAPGALGTIVRARALSATAGVESGIQLAATQTRLFLKLRRFGQAHALAESTLVAHATPSPREAGMLAPFAALGGHARLAARLMATAALDSASEFFSDRQGGGNILPVSVLTAAGRLAGYASLAEPADSLRDAHERLERAIAAGVRSRDQDGVRLTAALPSLLQAGPELSGPALATLRGSRNRLLLLWQALARGDTAGARRGVEREATRSAVADFAPAPDVSLQYALLALAIHDTSSATTLLDRVATALPTLGARLTTELFPAAALPRVLLLRARLAAKDGEARKLWSSARVLWSDADPELRALADRVP